MYLDCIRRFWNTAAYERYKIYKREKLITQQNIIEFNKNLAQYKLDINEYNDLIEYIKSDINCNEMGLDDILDESMREGINLQHPSHWIFVPLLLFNKNNKVHIEELNQKYRKTNK